MTNRRRLALTLVFLALVGGGVAFYVSIVKPLVFYSKWFERVRSSIYTLADKRPAEVSRGQWDFMIGWTLNLHGNAAFGPRQIDSQAAAEFADELDRRLQGPMNISDIDWIWDRYESFSEGGKSYSDKYRPTRPENLATAGE